MFAPAASAASASAQMRSSAGSSPPAPSETGQVKSIVCALKTVRLDLPEPLELLVAEDRVVDHELARMLGRLVEQVALRADERLHAHHDGFADRIDRWVRHLREQLLEVRVHQRTAVGQDGERRVVAHRTDRLLAVDREGREHHLHVLLRVAERQLQAADRFAGRPRRGARRQVGEPDALAVEPGAVRPAGGDLRLHLGVGDDPPLREVDEEELAGLETALAQDTAGGDVEHTGLRGEHHPAVRGLEPASGPQAVAVERRADQRAVGEGDRRRAVPRLGQALVEAVEAAQLVRHVGPARVGLRHHHHQRVRERAARQDEQLEHVVEDRRVRASRPDDGHELLHVVAEELGREL